jgi:HAMP domain-containing protein
MGRASVPHAQFNRKISQGDFDLALSIAKSTELILDLRQALDLAILAAKRKKPIFDPMAVRWIKAADDKGKLKLAELSWLAQTFENLRRGDGNSAKQLERFLERGRR